MLFHVSPKHTHTHTLTPIFTALQREEILKGQPVQALIQLLERGAPEERMAACGCLYALAQSTKHIAEVVNNRVSVCVCVCYLWGFGCVVLICHRPRGSNGYEQMRCAICDHFFFE